MRVLAIRTILGALLIALAALAPAGVAAQDFLRTVARVNESIVTQFELEQRLGLLQVLRTPGVTPEDTLDQLIDDRLKLEAARAAGIEPSFDEIQFGLEDFAGRAGLSGAELLDAVAEIGIAEETVRDYIRVLLAWGELLSTRFAAQARPSEDEIDRALALDGSGPGGSVRVLVSEIILPVTPERAAESEEVAARIAEIDGFDTFSAAARRFSIAASRTEGGRLDWLPLSDLPPQIAPLFLGLQPGDVTPPIPLGRGIALYQLRAIEDRAPQIGGPANLDFARLAVGASEDPAEAAARVAREADSCDDLYGLYPGASEAQLARTVAARAELPADIRGRLDLLDPGEVVALPAGSSGGGGVLMLCDRAPIRDEDLSREDIQRQLFTRRLEALGEALLAELRADAFIETDP